MRPLLILSGCPAAGKTTISRRLAQASARGVHLDTDRFYDFVVRLIPPVLPESRAQNETVAAAAAQSAAAFALGDFEVFVDGVIGPWLLPIWMRVLSRDGVPVDYSVLRAPLDQTLQRSRARDQRVADDVVRAMHAQFSGLGDFERHVVDTSGRTQEQTLAEISRRRARGDLRLDIGAVV